MQPPPLSKFKSENTSLKGNERVLVPINVPKEMIPDTGVYDRLGKSSSPTLLGRVAHCEGRAFLDSFSPSDSDGSENTYSEPCNYKYASFSGDSEYNYEFISEPGPGSSHDAQQSFGNNSLLHRTYNDAAPNSPILQFPPAEPAAGPSSYPYPYIQQYQNNLYYNREYHEQGSRDNLSIYLDSAYSGTGNLGRDHIYDRKQFEGLRLAWSYADILEPGACPMLEDALPLPLQVSPIHSQDVSSGSSYQHQWGVGSPLSSGNKAPTRLPTSHSTSNSLAIQTADERNVMPFTSPASYENSLLDTGESLRLKGPAPIAADDSNPTSFLVEGSKHLAETIRALMDQKKKTLKSLQELRFNHVVLN